VLAVTLAEGASPVAAGQRANKAAALACQALGAQSAMPSAEQIDG
jgi:sugar/nucleoside kinase (ribokinase family)